MKKKLFALLAALGRPVSEEDQKVDNYQLSEEDIDAAQQAIDTRAEMEGKVAAAENTAAERMTAMNAFTNKINSIESALKAACAERKVKLEEKASAEDMIKALDAKVGELMANVPGAGSTTVKKDKADKVDSESVGRTEADDLLDAKIKEMGFDPSKMEK